MSELAAGKGATVCPILRTALTWLARFLIPILFCQAPKKIQYIDPAAFALPALGAFGNLGRNALRGPGRDNWNLSLFKSFLFSETRGSRLEFRVETFNTWNHTQLRGDTGGGISNNFGASNFGQFTSAFDPRILQLGLKLYF